MDDWTFPYRVVAGVALFALWGAYDWWRHPENPSRLREYGFLFGVTAAAMGYGLVHDLVTYAISPEYYVLGKGLHSAAGGFNGAVVVLAFKATWTAGLIGAAALLVANNPGRFGPSLPLRRLLRYVFIPWGCSMLCEATGGLGGWLVSLRVGSENLVFGLPLEAHVRFCVVWGMHIGAYAGGVAGLVLAVVLVLRSKGKLKAACETEAEAPDPEPAAP